jgi:hypothetical protein
MGREWDEARRCTAEEMMMIMMMMRGREDKK